MRGWASGPEIESGCGCEAPWLGLFGAEIVGNLLQKRFLQFSTPWAGVSISNFQGFGKFVNRIEGL
jgi:hypothetical protein